MNFDQNKARQTSTIEFRHTDGSIQGGVVGGTLRESFGVTNYPRYGDTKARRFAYSDVAEILSIEPRAYVNLPTFSRLMGGLS